MFEKILIANRGEIACRVATTARKLGVKTVAVYSDADADAAHVALCDEAVHIGGSAPAESYLRWERILSAAQATGAQAVHPGYGFLSENEAFAQACADAGVVFIGPPPSAIRAMGLKAESKRLMEAAGVPLVPGYHGAEQDAAHLQAQADRIGYPVLIKASAGGGGKGMRIVRGRDEFAAALASCQREARNSFGNESVLIERYVQRPRHIEIQVFGDTHGSLVHLFERDCSVQRRHQKVLEEAPAPGMTPELRARMGAAAVAAARAVGYVGAGTVEFIVEQGDPGPDGVVPLTFFFMEMNTRLQVEHPVTEAITGLDLVEWQLRVACGEPLPLRQDELQMSGHAIEARICAESPDNQFLPATGTLRHFGQPACSRFERSDAGVRMDAGVRAGDAISPFYDSMIAKLIVHGADRAQALARLDAALAQVHIAGVHNNVQFLRAVLATRSFRQPVLDTALIDRERDHLFNRPGLSTPLAVAAAVAQRLRDEGEAAGSGPVAPVEGGWRDPWSRGDGWQSHAPSARHWTLRRGDEAVSVSLADPSGGGGRLSVRVGAQPAVEAAVRWGWQPQAGRLWLEWQGQRCTLQVLADGAQVHVWGHEGMATLEWPSPLHADDGAAHAGGLAAPMPGKVVSIAVAAGDAVKAGQVLAVMEAMKMEHTLCAPHDGVVAELLYAPGDQVAEGAALLRLQAAAE